MPEKNLFFLFCFLFIQSKVRYINVGKVRYTVPVYRKK